MIEFEAAFWLMIALLAAIAACPHVVALWKAARAAGEGKGDE
jgi:hypothetical protein